MNDFEDFKRRAENLLGKDAVDKIEHEIRNREREGEGKRELVHVENAELHPQRRQKGNRDSPTERLIATAIHREYLYGMLGLILGLSSIVGGVVLGLNGVAGATSWTAKLLSLESQINDAAPGVVLFIVGMFMIWITKPKVQMKDIHDNK